MAVGLRIFTNRTTDGPTTPILDTDNGEVLMHTQESVSIVLGTRAPESPGTLYVTSKQVIWLSEVDVSKGYAVDFVSITLHAISRDPEAFPSPCIYSQIETGEDEDTDEEEDEAEPQTTDWSAGVSKIKEMRLVPSDPNQLDTLFEVFCECAELNPEPIEGGDEEEHNWIFSADQFAGSGLVTEDDNSDWNPALANAIGYTNGHQELAGDVLQLQINDQRFEDAEEMEDDGDDRHQ